LENLTLAIASVGMAVPIYKVYHWAEQFSKSESSEGFRFIFINAWKKLKDYGMSE